MKVLIDVPATELFIIKFRSIKAIFSFANAISILRNVKIIIKKYFIKKMFQFEI